MPLTTVNQGLLSSDAQYTGFKNRLINGGMVIDQRNNGASQSYPTGTGAYTIDRWGIDYTQTSKLTSQQNQGAVTPPIGFSNYLGFTSTSAYSILSTDYFSLHQKIEGFNVSDLGWGTANASTVTLSFWVRSSLTGTFGGALRNNAGNRSYPFSYTISAANTWEQKSITIAGDTTGTWLTNNGVGIRLEFSLGVGSTFSGTAGSWSGSNFLSATGATSVVGTNGATFYITGVQLEKGSTATSFDTRSIGTELQLCQRYYSTSFKVGFAVANGADFNSGGLYTVLNCYSTSVGWTSAIFLPVSMRAVPTVTPLSTDLGATDGRWVWYNGGFWTTATATSAASVRNTSFIMEIQNSGGTWAANQGRICIGAWEAASEL